MSSQQLMLFPLLLVVEVQCQTAPYVTFMDQTLADHSYVDISQAGIGSDAVYCHTDLSTCCSGDQGSHRGDWYFPDGDRLPFADGVNPILESRQAQRLELRRTNPTVMGPTGIYRCDIETVAVHDNGMRETVYVGLYTSDGGKYSLQCNRKCPNRVCEGIKNTETPLFIQAVNISIHASTSIYA